MIRCDYSSVTFLNLDHLALICMTHDGLDLRIYRLPRVIFDVDTGVMHPPDYSLELPALSPATTPIECTLTRSPTSVYMPKDWPDIARDFYTDPNDALLTIQYEQRTPQRQYALVLGLRQLLSLLTPDHLGQQIAWAEWGPPRAHGSSQKLRHHMGWDKYSTFGMRQIGPYPTMRSDGLLVATIRDYHPCRVARARQNLPSRDGDWRLVSGGTVEGTWVGMNALETRLDFLEAILPLPEELQRDRRTTVTLGINEDGIVASTVCICLSSIFASLTGFRGLSAQG